MAIITHDTETNVLAKIQTTAENVPITPDTIALAKGYGYSVVPTNTPVGGVVTIDFDNGDIQILDMPGVDVTTTFSHPRIGSFVLIVNHAASEHVLILPSAYFLGDAGLVSKHVIITDSTASPYITKTVFSIVYDGTDYHISASTPASIVTARSFVYPTVHSITDGTTIDFDFENGDIQTLVMTANTVMSYLHPSIGGFTLIVQHDTTNSYTLEFPIGYFIGVAGKTAIVKTIDPKTPGTGYGKTVFNIVYDGTDYYVSEAELWA